LSRDRGRRTEKGSRRTGQEIADARPQNYLGKRGVDFKTIGAKGQPGRRKKAGAGGGAQKKIQCRGREQLKGD